MPLLALPVFWLLPLPIALPAYAAVVALSGWLYWLAFRAMDRQVITGREGLVGSVAVVLEADARRVSVRVHSEISRAMSKDRPCRGDRVEVSEIEGLVLRVFRLDRGGDGHARLARLHE